MQSLREHRPTKQAFTICGIIGAPHEAQFSAARSSALQWGQKKFTVPFDGNSYSQSKMAIPGDDGTRNQPCSIAKETVMRTEGSPPMGRSVSSKLWLQKGQLTEVFSTGPPLVGRSPWSDASGLKRKVP